MKNGCKDFGAAAPAGADFRTPCTLSHCICISFYLVVCVHTKGHEYCICTRLTARDSSLYNLYQNYHLQHLHSKQIIGEGHRALTGSTGPHRQPTGSLLMMRKAPKHPRTEQGHLQRERYELKSAQGGPPPGPPRALLTAPPAAAPAWTRAANRPGPK